jgi:hypothetical protein
VKGFNQNLDSVSLVIFSQLPINVPVPTATTFQNGDEWWAFVFEEPVTASGMQITWSNLVGPSVATNSCFVAISGVEAWTGNYSLYLYFY